MPTDQETTTAPDGVEQAYRDYLATLVEDSHVLPDDRDAGWSHAQRINRAEQKAKRVRHKLDSEAARSVYLERVAQMPQVGDRAYRYLSVLAGRADPNLSQCFVGPAWVLERLGGRPIGGRAQKDHQERAKRQTGWLLERELQAAGVMRRHPCGGAQFLLPAGVIDDQPWEGPRDWSNRERQSWKKKRRRAEAKN